MRTRRHDADLARDVPGIRRIMPFLMRGKGESAVLFEQTLDLERTLPWLEARGSGLEQRPTLFHLMLAAIAKALHDHPRLNRYVAARRLWQRREVTIAFAIKPDRSERASLSVVKLAFPIDERFDALVARVAATVQGARAGARSRSDREADLVTRLPRAIVEVGVRALRALDALGMAPSSMLEPDPMHASAFVANLGSLGLDAAYHHLYEYGTCPIFGTLGRIERRPMVVGDRVEPRTVATIRYSYDERIEDGFYAARALDELRRRVEDPASWIPATPRR